MKWWIRHKFPLLKKPLSIVFGRFVKRSGQARSILYIKSRWGTLYTYFVIAVAATQSSFFKSHVFIMHGPYYGFIFIYFSALYQEFEFECTQKRSCSYFLLFSLTSSPFVVTFCAHSEGGLSQGHLLLFHCTVISS